MFALIWGKSLGMQISHRLATTILMYLTKRYWSIVAICSNVLCALLLVEHLNVMAEGEDTEQTRFNLSSSAEG